MIKSYDQSVKKKKIKKNDNPNWLYIPAHPFRILIIGGSGSGKINVILNLNYQILEKFT